MNPKHNNSKYLIIVLVAVILLFGALIYSSFEFPAFEKETGETNNKVTNEITNTIVKYDELTINDVDEAIQIAAKKVESAVIGVTAKALVKDSTGLIKEEVEANYSTGSGVIYKREEILNKNGVLTNYKYYVITNRHVVTLDATNSINASKLNIYAYLGDEDLEIKATVVGYDNKVDVALITFESSKYIEPVKFGNMDTVEKGQLMIAVGNPGGYEYYGSVTFGVISSPERYISTDTDNDGTDDFYGEYIQHDVAINPGNSGGGLFNLKGELIGINTLKLVTDTIENMGFAIPISVVENIVINYIEKGKEITRPMLGVLGTEIRSLSEAQIKANENIKELPDIYNGEKAYGIYISEVIDGGTISSTPIEAHDILLAINDIDLTRMYIVNSKLNSLIDGFRVGETVTIKYYDRSSNQVKTVDVVLKG